MDLRSSALLVLSDIFAIAAILANGIFIAFIHKNNEMKTRVLNVLYRQHAILDTVVAVVSIIDQAAELVDEPLLDRIVAQLKIFYSLSICWTIFQVSSALLLRHFHSTWYLNISLWWNGDKAIGLQSFIILTIQLFVGIRCGPHDEDNVENHKCVSRVFKPFAASMIVVAFLVHFYFLLELVTEKAPRIKRKLDQTVNKCLWNNEVEPEDQPPIQYYTDDEPVSDIYGTMAASVLIYFILQFSSYSRDKTNLGLLFTTALTPSIWIINNNNLLMFTKKTLLFWNRV